MKILRIKLVNLNSLRGQHTIDFDKPPLAEAGLFAITGATGAGKSTLLDAITLALYGRAARYGSTPNPEDMMSRHCAECSAEVEFQVSSGIYRAVWQLHRSRGKSDGKVQAPKRYIYDANGQVLSQNIREAEAKIEELVGLDYQRFLRSVLLAQGEFAQFLKAKPDERAALLESLTGTSIYSELGVIAHNEAARREQDLLAQEGAIGQIVLLGEEQREKLNTEISTANNAFTKIGAELKAADDLISQANNLAEAVRREQQALNGRRALEGAIKAAESDLKRLSQHRLTIPFHSDLTRLEVAENALTAGNRLLKQVKQEHLQVLLKAHRYLPPYQQYIHEKIGSARKEIEATKEKHRRTSERKLAAEQWLKEHESEQNLSARLTDLASGLADLKSVRREFGRSWTKLCSRASLLGLGESKLLPQTAKDLDEAKAKSILSELSDLAVTKRGEAEKVKKEADVELRLREDHLLKARLVANFKDHRAGLREGEPCPLCGASEHPYTGEAPPSTASQSLEKRVEEAKKSCQRRELELNTLRQSEKDLAQDGQNVLTSIREGRQSVEQLKKELAGYGIVVPGSGLEDQTSSELNQRATVYQRQSREVENAQRELLAFTKDLDGLESSLVTLCGKQTELAQEAFPELPNGLVDMEEERAALPKWPNVEAAERDWILAKTSLSTKIAILENRQNDAQRLEEVLSKLELAINHKLEGSPFAGVDTLKAARLDQAEVQRIETIDSEYKNRNAQFEADLRAAYEQINALRSQAVPEGEAVVALRTNRDQFQEKRDRSLRDLTTWRNQLSQDDKDRKAVLEKQKALEALRKELSIWRKMQSLIGSHDGRKFRRYAQGISLDMLIHHGNRHLVRLSDRYRLKRREGEELELEIEDLHQANVCRPMASLSGGESFLASLALALGLSYMAGKNVRIESLFIDEGFGTLDADSLDLAICALETLRQDNKTVGVISHVHLLKERITTQIIVEKQSGGTSSIRVTT